MIPKAKKAISWTLLIVFLNDGVEALSNYYYAHKNDPWKYQQQLLRKTYQMCVEATCHLYENGKWS